MLQAKFAGVTIAGVTIGAPTPGASWTSHENTQRAVAKVWRVPVSVTFAGADQLRPGGVADAYQGLALYLTVPEPHAPALVVGEGPASIDAPVLVPAHPADVQVNVPILMYHRVGPYPSRAAWTSDYGYQIEYGLTVSPEQFAAEMDYLAAQHDTPISPTRLADTLLYGLPLPPHPVMLTFDDGRQSPWTYAVPVLRRYGFTAAFFVCSDFVGETNTVSP